MANENGLSDLIQTLREQAKQTREMMKEQSDYLKEVKDKKDLKEAEKYFKKLNSVGAGTDQSKQLLEAFDKIKVALEIPDLSKEEKEFQQNLLNELRESGKTEEERREQEKLFGSLIDSLEGFGKSVQNMEKAIVSGFSKAAKGASILGLLTMLLDPELFLKGVTYVVNLFNDFSKGIQDTLKNVEAWLAGDMNFWEMTAPIRDAIAEHWVLFTGAVVLFLAKFGLLSSIISGLGSVITGIGTAITAAMNIFGVGVMGAVGIIAGIAVAVVSAFRALWVAFEDAFSAFDESGSILDAIGVFFQSFVANFVGWILDLPKKLISWVAGALGFEEVEQWLDSWSFIDLIKEGFQTISEAIGSGIFKLHQWVSNFNLFESIMIGLEAIGNMIADLFKDPMGFVDQYLWQPIKFAFSSLGDFIESFIEPGSFVDEYLWQPIKGAFSLFGDAIDSIIDFGKLVQEYVWDPIITLFTSIGEFFGGLWDKVTDYIKTIPGASFLFDSEDEKMADKAMESGLVNDDFGSNSVDKAKMYAADDKTLKAILKEGNLDDESTKMVQQELETRKTQIEQVQAQAEVRAAMTEEQASKLTADDIKQRLTDPNLSNAERIRLSQEYSKKMAPAKPEALTGNKPYDERELEELRNPDLDFYIKDQMIDDFAEEYGFTKKQVNALIKDPNYHVESPNLIDSAINLANIKEQVGAHLQQSQTDNNYAKSVAEENKNQAMAVIISGGGKGSANVSAPTVNVTNNSMPETRTERAFLSTVVDY